MFDVLRDGGRTLMKLRLAKRRAALRRDRDAPVNEESSRLLQSLLDRRDMRLREKKGHR